MEHRGFVEAGELRHVLHLAELGRVHLLDVVLVHFDLRSGGKWKRFGTGAWYILVPRM